MPPEKRWRLRLRRSAGPSNTRSPAPRLTDEHLVILGLLLVILLVVSMLYCLGFASLALRQNWEQSPLPWNGTGPAEDFPSSTPLPDLEPDSPPQQSILGHLSAPFPPRSWRCISDFWAHGPGPCAAWQPTCPQT